MKEEKFLIIQGYEKYKISNYGRVYSETSNIYLKPSEKNGYHYINLSKNNKSKHFYIHRLVALYFVDGYSDGLEVNHIDENRLNNYYENLEWCTRKYNNNYGGHNERMITSKSKPIIQLTFNGDIVNIYDSIIDVERQTGYHSSNISEVCRHNLKQVHGFVWMFYDEYLLKSENKTIKLEFDIKHSASKKVLCITTGEIFDSMTEASIKYFNDKSKVSLISRCCSGERNYTGKHPVTGDKLKWKYVE